MNKLINEQIEQNQKILTDIENRMEEIKTSIDDLAKLISGYKSLQQKGMATKNELVNQQLNHFQQKTLYQSFYSKQVQQQIIIATLKSEFKSQNNQFESDILKYRIQKDDLNMKLMETEEISEYIVNSPTGGRLETSNITIGQIVMTGSALAQINPGEQRDYKLVFWVPDDVIAWLKQQESINIRYDAFPYEKFGQFTEMIESISTIPASAQELSFYKNSQINPDPDNPLYKVTASVQHPYRDV